MMVTVTHKVDQHMAVSLTVVDKPAPLIKPLSIYHREVPQAIDSREFRSPLGRWIYAEVTSVKSYFGRIRILKYQTP
jgi:hypothetical protein